MTKKQFERIVSVWMKRLGLTTWDLRINFDDPCDSDAHASMSRSNTYERGELSLDPTWKKWDRRFTNLIVVHELMHLLTRDVEEVLRLAGSSEDQSKAQTREIEKLVDKMAQRLVEIGGEV